MTFRQLFGETLKTYLLDFLADHPDFSYDNEVDDSITSKIIDAVLFDLLEYDLVIREKEKWKINTNNKLVQHVLQLDFNTASDCAKQISNEFTSK